MNRPNPESGSDQAKHLKSQQTCFEKDKKQSWWSLFTAEMGVLRNQSAEMPNKRVERTRNKPSILAIIMVAPLTQVVSIKMESSE